MKQIVSRWQRRAFAAKILRHMLLLNGWRGIGAAPKEQAEEAASSEAALDY
jgi:hypothetical protein